MKITMNTNEVSVCDGCSNWHICKFSEDVKRIEKQFIQMQENMNLPECVETVMRCKYKQYIASKLSSYNDTDCTMTGYNAILNSYYTPTETT